MASACTIVVERMRGATRRAAVLSARSRACSALGSSRWQRHGDCRRPPADGMADRIAAGIGETRCSAVLELIELRRRWFYVRAQSLIGGGCVWTLARRVATATGRPRRRHSAALGFGGAFSDTASAGSADRARQRSSRESVATVELWLRCSSSGAAEQGDEADEAFAGTMAGTEVPAHARAVPLLTRAPLRSLSPVFDRPGGVRQRRAGWHDDVATRTACEVVAAYGRRSGHLRCATAPGGEALRAVGKVAARRHAVRGRDVGTATA